MTISGNAIAIRSRAGKLYDTICFLFAIQAPGTGRHPADVVVRTKISLAQCMG